MILPPPPRKDRLLPCWIEWSSVEDIPNYIPNSQRIVEIDVEEKLSVKFSKLRSVQYYCKISENFQISIYASCFQNFIIPRVPDNFRSQIQI